MPAALITAVFYALHQDVWFWRQARPLVFGMLPIGLFYHAAYTLAASLLLAFLVRRHWPAHLEEPFSSATGESSRDRRHE